jgi:glycosyltransferase involved in cell wall biosynthesis
VTATVAISEETATETAALGLAAAERVIIPNGRDPELYRPGPQLADGDRRDGTQAPVRLLFVGHLNAGKGADLFADVVERLRHDGLDVVGVMAGEGPLADELSTRTGSPLQMLGHVDDVAAVMRRRTCSCFRRSIAKGCPAWSWRLRCAASRSSRRTGPEWACSLRTA